ncbi:MAG: MFS transporter [Desulfobacteraceae bacterium]|nr:MAG: MFS transporter [Desulfobacteraceae bacterium]
MDRKNIVLLLGMAGFIVMADNWVVSPILPAISENLGIAPEKAGLLISAYMIPFGIFQLIFGPLADRYGKKQVIAFSTLVFAFTTGLCAFGSGLFDLSLYRALTGVFAASVMPISLALIGDLFPIEKRQTAIGTFMGISFLGQGLSMATGGLISYLFDWRGVFAVYAALSVIPVVALFRHYREIPSVKHENSKFLAPYWQLLRNPDSFFTYVLVLLEGLFIIGSFSYLGAYIAKAYRFNYLVIGLLMTAFGLMTLVGGRLSGKLTSRIGARSLLTMGLAIAALSDAALCCAGDVLWVLLVSVGLLGLGFIFTHSTLLTRATQFAQKSRGAAMSLVAFCFMGGGGIGTAIGSGIIKAYGISNFFLAYGAALLCTLLLSFVLVRGPVVALAQSPAREKPLNMETA